MTVASGQIPYEYEWPTPFRVSNNSVQGLSGIHIEAAQFVMQAEMRKFELPISNTQQWRVFTNDSIAGSGYDPKANGNTLNGLVGPQVQVDLDHISIMRGILVNLILNDIYQDKFSEYADEELLEDWIRQTYPESPSGYRGSNGLNGQFLRPVLQSDGSEYVPSVFGDALLGPFTDSDPHWLGGSGIILDIDVGEVMWNPYPVPFERREGNTHAIAGEAASWPIAVQPFYPSFQRTNGALITLNGFENKWPEATPGSPFVLGYLPVGSGKVRFNAYPVLGDSEFFFGRMNDALGEVHKIGASTDKMTVAAISETLVLNTTRAIPGTEVFLNPIALASGVYRVAAKNSRINYPSTTVESGVVSQWPKLRNIIADYFGYEVFDNCFWVGDTRGPASIGGAPSGLSVVSPFTGKVLWQRNATNDIAVNLFISGTGPIRRPVRWWQGSTSTGDGFKSLQRVGTDDIKRLGGRNDPIVAGVSMSVEVATYNDLLTTVSSQSFDLSLRASHIFNGLGDTDVTGMTFGGGSFWIKGFADQTLAATTNMIWELDSSFSEIRRIYANDITGQQLAYISDGKGGATRLVSFNDNINNNEIHVLTISASAEVEGFEVSEDVKAIDWSTQTELPTVTTSNIVALTEVTGVSELKDGVYAYVRVTPTGQMCIVRIEEDASSWSVKGLWVVAASLNVSVDLYNHGLIVMPVN